MTSAPGGGFGAGKALSKKTATAAAGGGKGKTGAGGKGKGKDSDDESEAIQIMTAEMISLREAKEREMNNVFGFPHTYEVRRPARNLKFTSSIVRCQQPVTISYFSDTSLDHLGKLKAIEVELAKDKERSEEERAAAPLVFPCDAITLLFGFMFNRGVSRKVRCSERPDFQVVNACCVRCCRLARAPTRRAWRSPSARW